MSGTRGSSGFGSHSKEHMDNKTEKKRIKNQCEYILPFKSTMTLPTSSLFIFTNFDSICCFHPWKCGVFLVVSFLHIFHHHRLLLQITRYKICNFSSLRWQKYTGCRGSFLNNEPQKSCYLCSYRLKIVHFQIWLEYNDCITKCAYFTPTSSFTHKPFTLHKNLKFLMTLVLDRNHSKRKHSVS